jgi:ABC-type transport system substrate-binding protein
LSKILCEAAKERFEKALALRADTKAALEWLDRAEAIWPELPDLQNERLRLINAYPILRVGVGQLPKHMVPGLTCTDTERMAVELLFESLVREVNDPQVGHTYEGVLAERRPRRIGPLDRRFEIIPDAYWSDGTPVTGSDVGHTVRLLLDPKWPGYNEAWKEFLLPARPGGNPRHVTLALRKGHVDPLSFLTFKILPHSITATNGSKFDSDPPAGSGPYVYQRAASDENKVVFIANPEYARRRPEGKAPGEALPYIREIHFVHCQDPVQDFQNDKIDLVINPPINKIEALRALNKVKLTISDPMRNRRIYFLVVNHPRLRNTNLCRALAYAIDRQAILDQCAGEVPGKKPYRPLNGPFPPDSWACDPNAGSLFQLPKAKFYKDQAGVDNGNNLQLNLEYDKDDPQAEPALRSLVDQIQKNLGITIQLMPEEAEKLRSDVEKPANFDLAYYHYDYPSENYWLGPLFAALSYMNFQRDNQPADVPLTSLVEDANNFRGFAPIRAKTHLIHAAFLEKMPFIPLWQLDTVVVHQAHLQARFLDPRAIFPGVERWVLKKPER